MWHRKADFIPPEPPFIRCFGFQLRYADREREYDFRAYEYHHHTNLHSCDKGVTLTFLYIYLWFITKSFNPLKAQFFKE